MGNASSCFHVAKLARDRESTEESRKLAMQIPFQIMVVASFAISLFVPIIAIFLMPIQINQLLFLLVGQLMTANACLNLAKFVRDRLEVRQIEARLAVSVDGSDPA